MLYESQTSRTIVYDHRLIAGTMGIIFAAVSQCCPSESGGLIAAYDGAFSAAVTHWGRVNRVVFLVDVIPSL